MADWDAARELGSLHAEELQIPGKVFRAGDSVYRTTGERLGEGGMGVTYLLERKRPGRPGVSQAVAKLFFEEFLLQVNDDSVAKRHFDHTLQVLGRIKAIEDLHVMPLFAVEPIRDNFLQITPYLGKPFSSLLDEEMSPRRRVALLLQAVRGLRTLHESGILHSDFTPQNILIGDPREHAAVIFDFDLCVDTRSLGELSYLEHYEQRIVGSPEFSVPPELLDPVLLQLPLSPRRDVYAVGAALFSLFTDASVYGPRVSDLPTLLQRIEDGVVRQGESRIQFPDEVPPPVRAVIVRCMERDPNDRFRDATELVLELERVCNMLSVRNKSRFRTTLAYAQAARFARLEDVIERRPDKSVAVDEIQRLQEAMQRYGYVVEKSLGTIKNHPIYAVAPDPALMATGEFPGDNTYRKIVTAIDLDQRADAESFVSQWLGRIKPILDSVRTAHLTALHRVVVDRATNKLLLFSECLDDPRFGTALEDEDLTLHEALGVGIIIASQVAKLHEHGLAHNNVNLSSLLFKAFPDRGEVKPMFVGLVEPSFSQRALARDVRRLAQLVGGLIRPGRIHELAEEDRPSLEALVANLRAIAKAEVAVPDICGLLELLYDGLTLTDENFGVVVRHGGDPAQYAHVLIRHSLYLRLWIDQRP